MMEMSQNLYIKILNQYRRPRDGAKTRHHKALLALFLFFLFVYSCNKAQPEAGGTLHETAVAPADTPVQAEEPVPVADTDTASDPEADYRIPVKETPEYHSFIYRYERMREEQLDLLVASVTQYGLTVDMTSSQSLNSAGYGLYEKKDYAGAARFFREAAYVDINNVYAHYNLACSLSLLRDSIWADPEARMDYFNAYYNYDYFTSDKYNIYPVPTSFYNTPGDELCRDEIYDHLTLAFLRDRTYIKKSMIDKDLRGIHNHLRFSRLLQNIQTGGGEGIYGVYYAVNTFTKAVLFMLDGRITQIKVNNEADQLFFLIPYEDRQDEKEYTFGELVTGYEYILRTLPDFYKQQWTYENTHIRIYSIIMAIDFSKIPGYDVDIPKTYDFRYNYDTVPLEFGKDISFTLPDTKANKIEFIKLYSTPFNILFKENTSWSDAFPANKVLNGNLFAELALIYDRYSLLDQILSDKAVGIDMEKLILTACLYAKDGFLEKVENGGYNFNMEQFAVKSGDEILLYALGSGNPVFFKRAYSLYFNKLSPSQKDRFFDQAYTWKSLTYNSDLLRIEEKIKDGTFNDR
jgi:hypothetical protein